MCCHRLPFCGWTGHQLSATTAPFDSTRPRLPISTLRPPLSRVFFERSPQTPVCVCSHTDGPMTHFDRSKARCKQNSPALIGRPIAVVAGRWLNRPTAPRESWRSHRPQPARRPTDGTLSADDGPPAKHLKRQALGWARPAALNRTGHCHRRTNAVLVGFELTCCQTPLPLPPATGS